MKGVLVINALTVRHRLEDADKLNADDLQAKIDDFKKDLR